MDPSARDPVLLLRFALWSEDCGLAAALISAFAPNRTLSLRAMRELLRTGTQPRPTNLARRAVDALLALLAIEDGG